MDNNLNIYCLKAGKADTFVLVSAGGTVLIDTGLITEGSKIVSFLESRNIHKLVWLIITVTHGKNRFLFPGDAVSERITEKKKRNWTDFCRRCSPTMPLLLLPR